MEKKLRNRIFKISTVILIIIMLAVGVIAYNNNKIVKLSQIEEEKQATKFAGVVSKFKEIAVGDNGGILAIDNNGNLWTWGEQYNNPIQIKPETTFLKISKGWNHNIAIDINGNLWEWWGTISSSNVPIQIKAGTKFKEISTRLEFSMAIDSNGNLWAWGENSNGQLGNGTIGNSSDVPIQIKAGTKFAKISVGWKHCMAIDTSGNLWTWGSNFNHVLGNGGVGNYQTDNGGIITYYQTIPQKIEESKTFKEIAAGDSQSVAIDDANNLWTWGFNGWGMLGDGTEISSNVPIKIEESKTFTQITSGSRHSMAIDTSGNLWTWGSNSDGQLGNGEDHTYSTVPVQIKTGTKFTKISANSNYSLAIDNSGNLWAWGACELVDGTTTSSSVPIQITFATTHTVTFMNGSTTAKTETVQYGNSATAPTDLTKEGYTLSWDKDFTNITENTIINAVWTPNTYKIAYNLNSGTKGTYAPTTGTYDETVRISNPTRTGYTFTGWTASTSSGLDTTTAKTGTSSVPSNTWRGTATTNTYFKNLTPTNNQTVTLTANWEENTSSLTINPNGGSVEITGSQGTQTIQTSKTYTQEANTTLRYGIPTKQSSITTENYKVSYSYNGATSGDGKLEDTAIKTTTTSYPFSNWTKSSTFYGTLSTLTGSGTYTYPTNSGVTSTITANYTSSTEANTTTVTLPTPERTGYTFEGWYSDEALTTKIGNAGASYRPTANITLYAKWKSSTNSYRVEYYKQNITKTGYELVVEDSKTLTGATGQTVTAEEKTYEGFVENITHSERKVSGEILANGSLVLKRYYDRKTYTITFNKPNEDGTEIIPVTEEHTYGETITLPIPERPGYTFGGWYDNENFEGNPITQIVVNEETAEKEYYIKWIPNVYEVTLNTNGGIINSGDITEYTYGEETPLPTDITKPGYTFEGWYDNENFEGEKVTNITPTDIENKEYYLKWTANTNTPYKVEHYVRNLDTEVEGYDLYETEQKQGTTDTQVTAAYKEYEGFTKDENNNRKVETGNVNGNGTLVLKLYYSRNSYNISYELNGGTENVPLTNTYTYGKELVLSNKVTKQGSVFLGWYNNAELEGERIISIGKTEIGNKKYYAKWTSEEQYYITSNNYSINTEEEYITKVNSETNVSKLLENIQTNGSKKIVNSKNEEVTGNELVGTGYKLQVTFKGETKQYEIAVRGDIDGNGRISVTDLSMINQVLANKINLIGIKQKAADLDYAGGTTVTDLSMMNQVLAGKLRF